ncbi:hypothetical protein HMPREF9554_00418 [Treponema phagedenis F0421]|nr:hypothetical protein HMPREF9554_00418 [Treponema phagedenis F0421]
MKTNTINNIFQTAVVPDFYRVIFLPSKKYCATIRVLSIHNF